MSELLLHSFTTKEYVSNYVVLQGKDQFEFKIYQIDYSKYIQIRVTRKQTLKPNTSYSCPLSYILSREPVTGITSRVSFELKSDGDTKVLTLNGQNNIDASSGPIYLDIKFRNSDKLFTRDQGGGIPYDLNDPEENLQIPIACRMVFNLKDTNNQTFKEYGGFYNLTTYNYISFNFDPLPSPPTGYSFKNWNHAEKGAITGWNQTTFEKLDINVDVSYVTLDPTFTPNTYYVYYEAGGGIGDMDPSEGTYGESFRTTKCGFTKVGHWFSGWKDKKTGEIWGIDKDSSGTFESGNYWTWSGDEYARDIRLVAQWEPYTLTINYKKDLKSEDTPDSAKDPLFSETISYDTTTKIRTPKDKEIAISRLGYKAKDGYEWKVKEIRYKAKVEDEWKPKKAEGTISTINAGFSGKSNVIAEKLGTSIDSQYVSIDLIVNWEVYGLVHIYTNDGWKKAVPYIYTNSKKWERAVPYIYYNNKWNMGG